MDKSRSIAGKRGMGFIFKCIGFEIGERFKIEFGGTGRAAFYVQFLKYVIEITPAMPIVLPFTTIFAPAFAQLSRSGINSNFTVAIEHSEQGLQLHREAA